MDNLLSKMKYYYPDAYYGVLERAYNFSQSAHANQKRASGEDFFTHPYSVAEILVDLGLDTETVAASLLHDVVEDTPVTREQLRKEFGEDICVLVDGVTKLDKITFNSKEEEQAENLRKMFFAMAKDVRVVLIKLADRLHNMRSLSYLSPERRVAMARETLDIYAPLAGRLGISNIKCELEDLCLKYLDPEAYDYLANTIASKRNERFELVNVIIGDINAMLEDIGVKGEVFGRPKHFYSIYKKMKNQHKSVDEIYDLIAVRIIVEDIRDCYNVLGTIHTKWKPIPGRIKDYIAMPKPNMYQSLHTTVVTNYGQTFELQIRTHGMHRVAEYGVAAHWKYKDGGAKPAGGFDKKLDWIRELMEYEGDLKDSKTFYDSLKGDLVSSEVLVFTPKGDVISLPEGATPIDFAYHIHSAVGNKCVGAKVNGKMVKLDSKLQTGDVVSIITNQGAKGPSWDWLKIAKSSGAKAKIRQFFKREMKEENIRKGRDMLELDAKKKGFVLSELLTDSALKNLYDRFSFVSFDEVCAAVGYGAFTVNQVMFRLIDQNKAHTAEKPPGSQLFKKSQAGSVIIKGFDDLLVRFAGCCNPVPGDVIKGFISRGRGISVHRSDCPNLKNAELERLVDAQWAGVPSSVFSISLQVVADDTPTLMLNISSIIANMKLNMTAVNARLDKKGRAIVNMTVQISDPSDKDTLVKKLLDYGPIHEVFRTTT